MSSSEMTPYETLVARNRVLLEENAELVTENRNLIAEMGLREAYPEILLPKEENLRIYRLWLARTHPRATSEQKRFLLTGYKARQPEINQLKLRIAMLTS